MKKKINIIILIATVFAVTLLLIFSFSHRLENNKAVVSAQKAPQKALYWTCGMHPQIKQDKPGKCPICSMPLVPVYPEVAVKEEPKTVEEESAYYGCGVSEEGHCPHCDKGIKDAQCICGGHSFIEKGHALKYCPFCKKPLQKIEPQNLPKEVTPESKTNKVLHYRNPMHPEITSPTPMKDEMGMDYIPIYAEASAMPQTAEGGEVVNRVHLTENQMNLAGVVIEPVSKLRLSKEIRTVGTIAFDPELTVAQEEFITALETRQKVDKSPDPDVIARAQDLLDKSKIRLRLMSMSDAEITQLENEKKAQLSLVLPEDRAWVYAAIYEYDLAWVKQGQSAEITAAAYPGETFTGVIKSISPVLDPNTRSAKVRLEIDNPERKLKPEMYVNVIIKSVYKDAQGNEEAVAVPRDAVLDTGLRKIVYVEGGKGTFLGKEVKVGSESTATVNGIKQSFYPVLSGLKGDEKIVTKGNFLIDSQSQLTGGMSVLWGGSQEMKTEEQAQPQGSAPVQTQHRH